MTPGRGTDVGRPSWYVHADGQVCHGWFTKSTQIDGPIRCERAPRSTLIVKRRVNERNPNAVVHNENPDDKRTPFLDRTGRKNDRTVVGL